MAAPIYEFASGRLLLEHYAIIKRRLCKEPKPAPKPLIFNEPIIELRRGMVEVHEVVRAVCKEFSMSRATLHSKERTREIAQVRQLIDFLACEVSRLSINLTGERLGRDHTTLLYSCKRVRARLDADPAFRARVEGVKARLKEQKE